MNGCTTAATSHLDLTPAQSPSSAELSVRSQCTDSATAARLLVADMRHVPDKLASYT